MNPIVFGDADLFYDPALPTDQRSDETLLSTVETESDSSTAIALECTPSQSPVISSSSSSEEPLDLADEEIMVKSPRRVGFPLSKKYRLTTEFIDAWSRRHLDKAAEALGTTSEPAKAIIKAIFMSERSKKGVLKTLEAHRDNLKNIGVEGRLIYSKGKAKILIIRKAILGYGSTKACHQAIKFGGKSDSLHLGFKAKVTYTQFNPPRKTFNYEYECDLKKSIKYSRLLRSKTAYPHYFMKYELTSLIKSDRKKEKKLIAPLSRGGDLKDKLSTLSPKRRLRYIHQLLLAGAAMESVGLYHRDLKPENIFFHKKNIVIGDFGLCIHCEEATDYISGTGGYIPPFPRKRSKMSAHQDRYAIGIIILEIATGGHFNPDSVLSDDNLGPAGVASARKVEEMLDSLLYRNGHRNPLVRLIRDLLTAEDGARITLAEAAKRARILREEHVHLFYPAAMY